MTQPQLLQLDFAIRRSDTTNDAIYAHKGRMQHTACGVLPYEQIEVRLHRKRNGYDYFIASGNTRSVNGVCELFEPKLRQIVKGTTLRRPLRYNWILTASVNIPRLAAYERARHALRRECEPDP